jgi:hypothetical protein
MRLFIIIALFIITTSSRAFSFDNQDSIKVDKKRVEKVIKKIKKRREIENSKYTIKDFDKSKVTFSYADRFAAGQDFNVEVLYKGEAILSYGIKPDTYEFGEIIDLR